MQKLMSILKENHHAPKVILPSTQTTDTMPPIYFISKWLKQFVFSAFFSFPSFLWFGHLRWFGFVAVFLLPSYFCFSFALIELNFSSLTLYFAATIWPMYVSTLSAKATTRIQAKLIVSFVQLLSKYWLLIWCRSEQLTAFFLIFLCVYVLFFIQCVFYLKRQQFSSNLARLHVTRL